MKKNLLLVFAAFLFITFSSGSCKKPPKDNPLTTLTIQTSPANGSNLAAAPGPEFPLVVTVTSAMPSSGVKIDITARAEGAVQPYFTTSQNTSNTASNFIISGAPQGVTSVVDVTVTDLSNGAVKATSSYRFARK